MMKSSRMTPRRTMMPAPMPPPKAQAPPTVMMGARSSKIQASPSATLGSSLVPPP
jgi:hypothetical protein